MLGKRVRLNSGLPARVSVGRDGFHRLCELLELWNREQRQALLHSEGVKRAIRHLKGKVARCPTSERQRLLITAFYEQPRERLTLWKQALRMPRKVDNENSLLVPSLEFQALRGYNLDSFDSDLDEARLRSALLEFPDAIESLSDLPDWQRPALAAWPDLHRDVLGWETLSADQRGVVTLALFAVATILDNARFLHWAVDLVDDLVPELESMVRMSKMQAHSPSKRRGGEAVLAEWKRICDEISEITCKLGGDPPQPQYLQDLLRCTAAAEKLYDSLVGVLERNEREDVLRNVARTIDAIADGYDESPVKQFSEQVLNQWRWVYRMDGGRSVELLREDVSRVKRELERALERWHEAYGVKARLDDQLSSVRHKARSASDARDRIAAEDREVELHLEIAGVGKGLRDARNHVFHVVAPADHTFDPNVDYEQQHVDLRPTACPKEDNEHEPRFGIDTTSREDGNTAAVPITEAERVQRVGEATPSGVQSEAETDGSESVVGDEVVSSESPMSSDGAVQPKSAIEQKDEGEIDSSSGTLGTPETDAAMDPNEADGRATSARAALWDAIARGRLGIAYHIASLLAKEDTTGPVPTPELIAAAALARQAHSEDSKVVSKLSEVIESIDPENLLSGDWRQAEEWAAHLLLFSATLRPALFAPSTGAASLLGRVRVSEALKPIYDLSKILVDHANRLHQLGVPLAPSLFQTKSDSKWQGEFDSYVMAVREWQAKAKSKHNIFTGADRVWRRLLSDNGHLAELVSLITTDDAGSKIRVTNIYSEIRDRKAFSELVHRTDRSRRKGPKGSAIQGRALKQIWNDVQPAIRFSAQWLRLIDTRPRPGNYVSKRVDELRRDLYQYGSIAIEAIETFMASETSEALLATLRHAKQAVEEVLDGLDGHREGPDPDEDPEVVQSCDLLYVTELDLDTRLRPVHPNDEVTTLDLLLNTDAHADTLRAAFAERLARGDLIGAILTFRLVEAEGGPSVERCRASLEEEIENLRQKLPGALNGEERRVEYAFCHGQIDPDERDEMSAEIASMRKVERPAVSILPTPEEVNAVASALPKIHEIGQKIKLARQRASDKARNRLLDLPPERLGEDTRATVIQSIEKGYILTAHEQIGRLERGESLQPPLVTDDPFREFVSVVDNIERILVSGHMAGAVVTRRVREKERIGDVSFRNLSQEEANQSGDLLEAWYELARSRRVEKDGIQDLLERLGFKVRNISTDNSQHGWPRVRVTTESIEDRALCPSRQFGSEAEGRYRVVLNWERPAAESILRAMGEHVGIPTIVLHFGCLGADRENLRAIALQSYRLFLVVDESLILFLAQRASKRLSALFRCSLPYTCVDPYATTSGLVPPELFYGRERERQTVMDRSGACFIYGGRQLGKTALLRSVERDFMRSHEFHIAKWIDLKVNEIGYARGPSDIWPLLQRELARLNVVHKRGRQLDPGNRKNVDRFLDQIRKWLSGRDERRLILLLDEADEFLRHDAKTDFTESARLKGLMDETQRRFKVVFAGLHNVLRTTQQANHPLAHFGDPICVGAMLSNGEWRQAQALVREPLVAIGCQFKRDDLSTRILAHTNYYPSLIQLYGAELVRRLRDSKKPFPYEIDDTVIDDAFASPDLRNAIRERFLLTLQLDERYAVIAYALAFEFIHGDLNRGLDRNALLHLVQDWWQEGFSLSDLEFTMLLHEMEGLGVLRAAKQERYTLRNPNIVQLLGNSDDIEKELAKERKLPTVYEPRSFRARYPTDRPSHHRRGPLTFLQETDLRKSGVAIISGCNAAGLENVEDFLSQRIGTVLFKSFPQHSDKEDFRAYLSKLRLAPTGMTVYLVPLDVDWDVSWLEIARQLLAKKVRGNVSRIAFMSPPEKLWQLENAEIPSVDWIKIGPCDETFLRRWLQDIDLTANVDHADALLKTSGGWMAALEQFGKIGRRRASKSWQTRIETMKGAITKDSNGWITQRFGLSEEAETVLRGLVAADEPFDHDSIELVSDDIGIEHTKVRRRVKWSESLGFLSTVDEDCWILNPLLKRLLVQSTAE